MIGIARCPYCQSDVQLTQVARVDSDADMEWMSEPTRVLPCTEYELTHFVPRSPWSDWDEHTWTGAEFQMRRVFAMELVPA